MSTIGMRPALGRPQRSRASLLLERGISSGTLVAAAVLLIMIVIFVSVRPTFLRGTLFTSLVLNGSLAAALAAAGLALVVLVGGLDLSIAGSIALANALLTTQLGGGPAQQAAIILMVLVIGAATGYVNGLLVTVFGLEPVVVTLGTGFILSGTALLILPAPASVDPDSLGLIATLTTTAVVPGALVLMCVVAALWLVLRRSSLGAHIIAVGSDPHAAAQNGVRVGRTKRIAFAGSGLLYALAGAALTSQTLGGDTAVAQDYLLTAFAAVVIGGISMGGGRGSVVGAIMGAVTLTVAINLLFAIGLASFWGVIAKGFILLAAVALQAGVRALHQRLAPPPPPTSFSPDWMNGGRS